MQKKRTRAELISKPFLNITDISRLLDVSWYKAEKIYTLADKIDHEELKGMRIEPTRVRITSVCKVIGMSLNTLRKLVENEKKGRVSHQLTRTDDLTEKDHLHSNRKGEKE